MNEDDREAADELGLLIRDIYREHGMYTPDQEVADLIIEAGYRKVIQPIEQDHSGECIVRRGESFSHITCGCPCHGGQS